MSHDYWRRLAAERKFDVVDVAVVAALSALFGGYVAWFVLAVRNDGRGWRRPPRHAEAHWSARDGRSELPDQPFTQAVPH